VDHAVEALGGDDADLAELGVALDERLHLDAAPVAQRGRHVEAAEQEHHLVDERGTDGIASDVTIG
jgi:hypothetical protein